MNVRGKKGVDESDEMETIDRVADDDHLNGYEDELDESFNI